MKTNKFLLGILTAGAMFASCSNELPGNEQVENGGKGEKSFMSVAIKQANGSFTRSTADGAYLQGTEAENAVNTLSFFFFKSDGNPFDLGEGIVDAHAGEEAEGDVPNKEDAKYSENLYQIELPNGTDNNDNVDYEYGATLVIEHNVGNIPAAIVAVINHPNPELLKDLSIDKLQQEILTTQPSKANFVMCNSVYQNAAGIAMETPITADNLGKNAEEALANPVDIYVERVAARVDVKAGFTESANTDGAYPVGKTIKFSDASTADVYAKILGWDINTYADKTNLIKNIDGNASWNLGWTWNNAADFRSYWANNVAGLSPIMNFTWATLHGTVNTLPSTGSSTDYCYENTTTPTRIETGGVYDRVESRKNNTKVLVKAEIQNAAGNVLKFANWYGQNYKADSDNSYSTFKGVVANSLKNKLVKKDGSSYTPIAATDIELRQGTGTGGEDSYKVYFEFTETAKTENWYYLDNGAYIAYADGAAAATALRATEPARIWNGMAYYFVNIEHLGAVGKTTDGLDTNNYIEGYYGVVRNHAYELTFTDISGLGTPVYNETQDIPYPVEPDMTESFIAAKIKVLAWKWIKKDVVLGK